MFRKLRLAVICISASTLLASVGCTAKAVAEEPAGQNLVSATPTPMPKREPFTFAGVGDIMMASPFPDDTRMPPNDGADLLKSVIPILSAADIAFGNLEGPMVDSGLSAKCPPASKRCFAFRMPTRYGKYLKDAGFDVMSLANNHSADFGDVGRSSTRDTLDDLGIKHAGSDRDRYSTTYLTAKGNRVAVIAFATNKITPNVNDLAYARKLVLAAGKQANIVIVSFHGGAEGTDNQRVPSRTEMFLGEARGNLRLFARTVVDAGADLVIGHGPHVLRGMEIYKDRLVAYSMGNFCTYGWFQLLGETALTAILEAKIGVDGKFLGGKLHAGRQEGRGIPMLDPTGAAIRKVRELSTADFGVNAPRISDDGTIAMK